MADDGRRDLPIFKADALHELRSPLLVILGYAETLDEQWDDFAPGEEGRLMVQVIARNARRLHRLCEDLLILARLDEKQLDLQMEDVELSSALSVAHEIASAEGERIEVEAVQAHVRADPDRLAQVISVLVTNGFHHGAPPYTVSTRVVGDVAEIVVQDGGTGVSLDDQDALFERFSRLALGKSGSNGLGLSIARSLARAMGGDLDYREEDGRSQFVASMPLASAQNHGP